ncbi:MAG: spermidine/putrescine ABC transporter substrate-binding protein [Bifidobacteriaceae bacterium]|jgi:spermidine/putrescine transport system substrate-binding protein|nr:spermidine/putrescine ABC transporter substrate-binding protein [Bifidobacteriaceae bacterium]
MNTSISRVVRRSAGLAAAATVAAALAACGGGVSDSPSSGGPASPSAAAFNPATSGELTIYTWSDYFPTDLAARFEDETGIKVTLDYYENNEAMMTKIEAAGAGGYDIVVPSDYAVDLMVERGQLMQINALDLPNGQNILPEFRDVYYDPGRLYSAPYLYGSTGYSYDASLLAEGQEPPASWMDYFTIGAPFAGKVGIMNDQVESVNAALRAVGAEPCTDNPEELQAAADLLAGFKDKVLTISSDGILDRLGTGDNSMAMIWNGASHRAALTNPNVVFVYAEEGLGTFQDNWAVTAGAKNVDQALTFINWMLDPANAAEAANYQGYNAAIAGVSDLLEPELKADPAIVPPPGVKLEVVPTCPTEVQNKYTQIWESFKG